jgi:hypothetical protein
MTARTYPSSDSLHYFDYPCPVPLRVHRIRDLGARVAERELSGLEPENPPQLRRGIVAELLRVTPVDLSPRDQLIPTSLRFQPVAPGVDVLLLTNPAIKCCT